MSNGFISNITTDFTHGHMPSYTSTITKDETFGFISNMTHGHSACYISNVILPLNFNKTQGFILKSQL